MDGHLYEQAAAAYVNTTQQGRSALLVSPTWAEIEAVTGKVREALKARGLLGSQEQAVRAFDSLSWTSAQKTNPDLYRPGHHVRFTRPSGPFDKGELAEVITTGGDTLKLRRADGSQVAFTPSRVAGCIDVGEARELKVSPGDWLLLQANAVAAHQRFTNGERVQVKRLTDGATTLELTDGRVLPADYRTFTHGYAVTSHSSQGKTVDEVLVVASSKSFPAVSQEQFYVSISRARERVHIFTDDTETLRRRVGDSRERMAALELAGLRDELEKLGFRPKQEDPGVATPAPASRFRTIRTLRPARITRLAPVQRILQVAEDLAHWIAERIGLDPKRTEGITPIPSPQTSETTGPALRHQPVPATTRPSPSRGVGI